jgi:tRNA pseudouridine38-40 synthase
LPLELDVMQQAARLLVGEHDFSAFRSSECQASSPVRTLQRIDIERRGVYVVFDFCANGFLHHMVRNLVGTLIYVGKGKHDPEWVREVLVRRQRSFAAPTFEAAGLYLARVEYDSNWSLPTFSRSLSSPMLEAVQL